MKDKTNIEGLIDSELDKLAPGVSDTKEIDVDNAWNKVLSKMNEPANEIFLNPDRQLFTRNRLLKIAAALLVLIGLGAAAIFVGSSDSPGKPVIASTGDTHRFRRR